MLVFAQMEGRRNQKIQENGPPEGQKCCRGSKCKVATPQDAIFAFKIKFWCQKWIPKDIDKSICEGLLSKRLLK